MWDSVHASIQIARNEYRKKTMTSLFGSAQVAVKIMSVMILCGGAIRNISFEEAISNQLKHDALDSELVHNIGYAVLAVGMLLVLSSTWALGWDCTFLGQCVSAI